jgi:cobyric acid synthase
VEANRELADTLDETVKAYQEGAASRDEVASAAEELLKKYDLENEKILLLTGNYEALTKAIKDKQKTEEKNNIEA